jgi:polyisoprenoid-binding protein YceI
MKWSLKVVAGIVVVAVAGLGFATWYFVFRDDSPPAVSLKRATKGVDKKKSSATGVDGTWKVDDSIGDFSDFTSSFVGFRVQEELAGIGAKSAVGRTPDVTGTLVIEGTTVPTTKIDVDMTTLETDDSRRDGAIRRQAIETSRFPTAAFELTEPVEFDAVPEDGTPVSVNAVGNLTLHGVTREVTFPLKAQLNGDVITVTGSLDVQFADYDIGKPSAAIVLSVEDHGVIELQLFFTKS